MTAVLPAYNLLNEKQAAALMNVSVSFLQKLRIRGGGPKFLKISKSIRYRKSDIETYLSESERQSTSQSFKLS